MNRVEYLSQEVPSYRGNPLIEALPALLDKPTFYFKAKNQPVYDPALRQAPAHIRAHLITDAFDLFVPLPRHYTEQTVIARMIRRGYLARNPLPPTFWKDLDQTIRSLREDFHQLALQGRENFAGCSSDLSTAKIGITGCGKTLSSEICLQMYPQVVEHGSYYGQPLNIRQVVWLRLQASHKGSTKDLCLEFFREMDRLLDTNYVVQFGRRTEYEMLGSMVRLAALHALGILVIDETQEFSNVKSGGAEGLVGFLLRLTNSINVPVLMIGTYKAARVLHNHMRHIRRSTGIGMPEWLPLNHDTEWEVFLQQLWKYQYTRTNTNLTPEISAAMYDECQGIPDFATKILFLAQDRLIATSDANGAERITVGVIKSVARDYLKPAREALQAIKTRNKAKLEALEDVELPTLAEYAEQQRVTIEIRPDEPEALSAIIPGIDTDAPHNQSAHYDGGSKKSLKRKPATPNAESVLANVVGTDVNDASSAYERLSQAGLIKSGAEFYSQPKE